jgi:ketosteroid isomerase-like protein
LKLDTIQQEITRVQQAFWLALKSKDARQFEAVLADDFSSVRPLQSRGDFIATLTSFPIEITSITADDLQVHHFGDLAVLTGTQVAQLRFPDGRTITQTLALTNLFRFTANQWRMVFTHPVEITAEVQV